MTKYIYLTLIVFSIQFGFSQSLDTAKLNAYFNALEDSNKYMGSVALLRDGEVIYTHQLGLADLATQKVADNNTKYRIGSISKTFTATLVMKAIEEGELAIDQNLKKYFPSIKNSGTITISNLLNHRSGIHNFTNDKAYMTYNTHTKSETEMVAIISKAGSDFKPNSKAAYSNSNYVLLSYILEKIYKKSFAELLNEKIIRPLGLKNTANGGKINVQNNEANSYTYVGEWNEQTETDLSVPMGAGCIISSPSDLLLFADALFNYKIISEKSLTTMKTLEENYGMGLFKIPFYDKFGYSHTGGIDGFTSVFGYFEEEKCGFAITSNGANYENNSIAIAMLSAYFNKPFDIPTFSTFIPSPEDLESYVGLYSSASFPLKITITKSANTILAQATGQSAFSLEATEKNIFKFDQAGIVLEFNTAKNQMTLKQGGGIFTLDKE